MRAKLLRIFAAFFIQCLLATGLTACGNDNDEPADVDGITPDKIIGCWVFDYPDYDDGLLFEPDGSGKYFFFEDGICTESTPISWRLNGERLTIISQEEGTETVTVESVNSKMMVISDEDGYQSYLYKMPEIANKIK